MSDNKPTFSFGAPPAENKTTANSFGQAALGTSSAFGAPAGTSSAPSASAFGTFGAGSKLASGSAFGGAPGATGSSQASSLFGGQPKSGGFSLGGGTTGSLFGATQDPKKNESSTSSVFSPDKSSTGAVPGGAQSTGGGLFQNLGQGQPNPAAAGLSTPASSKPTFSFSNVSTTPAGPPPTAANSSTTPAGSVFSFAKPQQPASSLFAPKSDTQAPAQSISTSAAPTNASSASSNPSNPSLFGAQTSAGGQSSSQTPGGLFAAVGAGSKPGMFGSKEAAQTTPSLFGTFNKPSDAATPATGASSFAFPAKSPEPTAINQQSQQNQPDGVPKTTNPFGAPNIGTASTAQPQSTAGNGGNSSQPKPSLFQFPTGSSASNAPQSSPATSGAPGATSGLFGRPNMAQPSAPTTSNAASGPSLFAKPGEPAAADRTSATTTTTATSNPSSTSSAPAPATTTAGASSLGGGTAPAASAAAGSNTTAPAAGAAPQTTSANLGASTTGPAPPPQSRLKNKSMEEIITSWAKDLGEYQKEFQKQADQIASWDQLLVENGDKIQKLYASTFEAERASSEVERQLSSVVSQQEELSGWLDRYEREVDDLFSRQIGQGEVLQGPDQERERTYKLAEKLSDRLDEMGKDLKTMIEEINSTSLTLTKTNKTDDPLSQIVKILNSHLASLQWIDQNAAALQTKVSAAQKVGQGLRSNGHNGLGEDSVDDFYKSYQGRR